MDQPEDRRVARPRFPWQLPAAVALAGFAALVARWALGVPAAYITSFCVGGLVVLLVLALSRARGKR